MEIKSEVDKYIASQPEAVREILEKIRQLVLELAPEAIQKMGYGIPEFNFHGPLIYFAGFKNHIGIYPTSSGISAFSNKLKSYKTGKGSVQFPLNQPIPYDLIKEIVQFKIQENLAN